MKINFFGPALEYRTEYLIIFIPLIQKDQNVSGMLVYTDKVYF